MTYKPYHTSSVFFKARPPVYGFGHVSNELVDLHDAATLEASPLAFEDRLLFRAVGWILSALWALGVCCIGATLTAMHVSILVEQVKVFESCGSWAGIPCLFLLGCHLLNLFRGDLTVAPCFVGDILVVV
jgi:hypothetical protein